MHHMSPRLSLSSLSVLLPQTHQMIPGTVHSDGPQDSDWGKTEQNNDFTITPPMTGGQMSRFQGRSHLSVMSKCPSRLYGTIDRAYFSRQQGLKLIDKAHVSLGHLPCQSLCAA